MRGLVAVATGLAAVASVALMAAPGGTALATALRLAASQTSTAQAGTFHPVDSVRSLDTRRSGGLASARIVRFGVAGHGPIAAGASAVTVNVTVQSPARSGSISVFPGDAAWNGAASISFVAGQTKQRMITAVLGANGSLAAEAGSAAA